MTLGDQTARHPGCHDNESMRNSTLGEVAMRATRMAQLRSSFHTPDMVVKYVKNMTRDQLCHMFGLQMDMRNMPKQMLDSLVTFDLRPFGVFTPEQLQTLANVDLSLPTSAGSAAAPGLSAPPDLVAFLEHWSAKVKTPGESTGKAYAEKFGSATLPTQTLKGPKHLPNFFAPPEASVTDPVGPATKFFSIFEIRTRAETGQDYVRLADDFRDVKCLQILEEALWFWHGWTINSTTGPKFWNKWSQVKTDIDVGHDVRGKKTHGRYVVEAVNPIARLDDKGLSYDKWKPSVAEDKRQKQERQVSLKNPHRLDLRPGSLAQNTDDVHAAAAAIGLGGGRARG